MFDKLESLARKYEELGRALMDPKVLGDATALQRAARAHAELTPIMDKYTEHLKVKDQMAEIISLLSHQDKDLVSMAKVEMDVFKKKLVVLEEDLKIMLLPENKNDDKNVIIEIRAGTGGDEAGLFVANLFRMYARFAEKKGWKAEVLECSPTSLGGFKEIVFSVQGRQVYRFLKFEGGVHRVQRVPTTETSGRLHTSAVTVAVLLEAEEVEINILPQDIRIDTFCSSGPGGQSVNTTYSAVRITHLVSGIVVSCQDEKSQIKNKAKAMRVLRARLKQKYEDAQQAEIAQTRLSMVGSGDRSEKIRTYNFPQNRLTDHRIGMSWQRLEVIINGDLAPVVDALILSEQTETLKHAP